MIEAAERDGRAVARPGRPRADERQHRHLAGHDLPPARLPHARRDARVGHARARRLLRMYGAEIVWSPGELGSNGAVALARELAAARPRRLHAVPVRQPGQPRRALPHDRARDPRGARRPRRRVRRRPRHGRHADGHRPALREANPACKIVAAEPLQGDAVMGLRSLEDGYTPEILDVSQLDRKRARLQRRRGASACARCSSSEGLWAGVSAGAVLDGRRAASPRAGPRPERRHACSPTAAGSTRRPASGTPRRDELEEEMEDRLWW